MATRDPQLAPAPAGHDTAPAGDTRVVALRDGTVVTLRPIGPADADALVRFHATLSAETQYLRYFSCHARLSPREVHWFTNVDRHSRDAYVAVEDGEIVGVGRLDAVPGSPRDAEVAFVVTDRLQGQGLGSALFARVAERAAELGFERLVAETLLRNRRMLAVFERGGLPVTTRFEDGLIHVAMDLSPLRAAGAA